MMPLPQWVIEAARLPVAFAQVREDPAIDLAVLNLIDTPSASAMVIASGGCTAAYLAASGRLSHLHLVDFNPAQMELCLLKLQLLQHADPVQRLAWMGHAPQDKNTPDFLGRYEVLFVHLQAALQASLPEIESILMLEDPAERSARIAPSTPLGKHLDAAFDEVMALPNLVALFGDKATQNAMEPFSRHFARRTRIAIASLPTANNPYLWQLLLGKFPAGISYPWFTASVAGPMPQIAQTIGTVDSALAQQRDRFDFIHLSNVLDWLSVAEARTTLQLAFDALHAGGYVIVRQLNSSLNLPVLGDQFKWLTQQADRLHTVDRSFFYRSLHLGKKR